MPGMHAGNRTRHPVIRIAPGVLAAPRERWAKELIARLRQILPLMSCRRKRVMQVSRLKMPRGVFSARPPLPANKQRGWHLSC